MKYFVSILFFLLALGFESEAQKQPLGQMAPETKTMVRFYPNPAVNYITFEFKEPVSPGTYIHVFSFLGRQVTYLPVNSQRITVNVSDYFRGVYVFQLRNSLGKILETNKFQVNR